MWLFIGPHKAGAEEGLRDEKEEEVVLISAQPQAVDLGTCYNALHSSGPLSSSSAVTRLEQLSLRSFPAFCNLFWNLVNERLMSILKWGRKGQRKAGKGERERERNSIIICYGTLGKELSPVWISISFPLKWGSFIFNIPFNSHRLYKSINWIFCPWVLISMGKRPWVKSLPWMDPDCLHFSITPFNCEHLHQLIFRTGRGRNTTL